MENIDTAKKHHEKEYFCGNILWMPLRSLQGKCSNENENVVDEIPGEGFIDFKIVEDKIIEVKKSRNQDNKSTDGQPGPRSKTLNKGENSSQISSWKPDYKPNSVSKKLH